MAEPIDLEKLNNEQLKALAYDQIVLSQQIQNNLNAIQAILEKRAKMIVEVQDDKP